MAKQVVDFTQGGPLTGDSGERGNSTPGVTAIKPYTDGERAVSTNFDRPPENLRQRTEVLRTEMEEQKYLQDSDMRWTLGSGNADGLHAPAADWPEVITWAQHPTDSGLRWYFEIGPGPATALVVQPLNTPRQDMQESKTWEFPFAASGFVTIATSRRSYSGANIREIVWEALPFASIAGINGVHEYCDLLLSGEDDHILTITIRDDDLTTVANLQTGFTAYFVSLGLAGFTCSTSGDLTAKARIGDIPAGELDYIMSGTQERELHYIPTSAFVDFFDVEDPLVPGSFINCLADGDTISIVWEYFVEPGGGTDGRCQAIPASGNTTVLFGQLFNTRLHPEYIPLAIPLCKRIGNELVWLDGTIITESMVAPSVRFGENGYTVDRIYTVPTTIPITMTSKWYASAVVPVWATIQQALDGIVADLADAVGTCGCSRIGMATTAIMGSSRSTYNVPAPGESLETVIVNILTLLDSKASLPAGAAFGAEESVSGRWIFENHARLGLRAGVPITILRSSPADAFYHLVYRNDGQTEGNTDIDWSTYSVYEKVNAGVTTQYVEVTGAYLSTDGTTVTTPAGGSGVVNVTINGGQLMCSRAIVVAPQTLTVADPTDWDFHEWPELDNVLGDLRLYKVISGNDYDAGVTYHAFYVWRMDQRVEGIFDLRHRDALHTFPALYPAELNIATIPYTQLLEGLEVYNANWPDPVLGTPVGPADPYQLYANKIAVMPGRAFVNGKPIRITVPAEISAGNVMNSTVLPIVDGDPQFYYVWLRSDFEESDPTHDSVFIGEHMPQSAFNADAGTVGYATYPGTKLYRPVAAEVHPGYTEADYLLIGVVYLVGVDPGPPFILRYFADVVNCGGDLWKFRMRYNPVHPAPATVPICPVS
jgi:hypothetical protein